MNNTIRAMITRWGAMIVHPRSALTAILDGESGGLRDLLILLVLQLFTVHLPQLVRLSLFIAQVDGRTGFNLLFALVGSVLLIPLAAVLLAQLVMGWLVRPPLTREHNLDLASLSYLPMIYLQMAVALLSAIGLSHALVARLAPLFMAAGAAWFIALLVLSARLAKMPKSSRAA